MIMACQQQLIRPFRNEFNSKRSTQIAPRIREISSNVSFVSIVFLSTIRWISMIGMNIITYEKNLCSNYRITMKMKINILFNLIVNLTKMIFFSWSRRFAMLHLARCNWSKTNNIRSSQYFNWLLLWYQTVSWDQIHPKRHQWKHDQRIEIRSRTKKTAIDVPSFLLH